MDQATEETRGLRELIEEQLNFGKASWERLPEVEAEIGNWDPDDAEVFILEWSIEEDRLDYLEEYYKAGAMTEDQVVRYEELKKLVVKNHPIIERLADRQTCELPTPDRFKAWSFFKEYNPGAYRQALRYTLSDEGVEGGEEPDPLPDDLIQGLISALS